MATATKPTKTDLAGLQLLADHYALAVANGTDTYMRVSNATTKPTQSRPGTLYWQTADRLAAQGLAEKRRDLARLNRNGALLALAGLAGWEKPADAGDPYVIDLCVKTARKNGEAAGWDDELIASRIDPLEALAYS